MFAGPKKPEPTKNPVLEELRESLRPGTGALWKRLAAAVVKISVEPPTVVAYPHNAQELQSAHVAYSAAVSRLLDWKPNLELLNRLVHLISPAREALGSITSIEPRHSWDHGPFAGIPRLKVSFERGYLNELVLEPGSDAELVAGELRARLGLVPPGPAAEPPAAPAVPPPAPPLGAELPPPRNPDVMAISVAAVDTFLVNRYRQAKTAADASRWPPGALPVPHLAELRDAAAVELADAVLAACAPPAKEQP